MINYTVDNLNSDTGFILPAVCFWLGLCNDGAVRSCHMQPRQKLYSSQTLDETLFSLHELWIKAQQRGKKRLNDTNGNATGKKKVEQLKLYTSVLN